MVAPLWKTPREKLNNTILVVGQIHSLLTLVGAGAGTKDSGLVDRWERGWGIPMLIDAGTREGGRR